jgi:drug/metabolite transporter (DMT)-like permease
VRQDWSLHWLVWAAIVFGTLGPLVLTNVLWFRAVSLVGPSRATLFVTLQPFVGAFFALILLHEGMGWLQVGGGALIAAGLLLSRRRAAVVAPVD